jgi:hypothetical protein
VSAAVALSASVAAAQDDEDSWTARAEYESLSVVEITSPGLTLGGVYSTGTSFATSGIEGGGAQAMGYSMVHRGTLLPAALIWVFNIIPYALDASDSYEVNEVVDERTETTGGYYYDPQSGEPGRYYEKETTYTTYRTSRVYNDPATRAAAQAQIDREFDAAMGAGIGVIELDVYTRDLLGSDTLGFTFNLIQSYGFFAFGLGGWATDTLLEGQGVVAESRGFTVPMRANLPWGIFRLELGADLNLLGLFDQIASDATQPLDPARVIDGREYTIRATFPSPVRAMLHANLWRVQVSAGVESPAVWRGEVAGRLQAGVRF